MFENAYDWINFLFGGFGFFLGSLLYKLKNKTFSKVKFTLPVTGSNVAHHFECSGTRSQWINYDIWLIVYPLKAGRYFPQKNIAVNEKPGLWRAMAYAGSAPDTEVGDGFLVFAVTADNTATNMLKNHINTAEKTHLWKGMEKLPEGCTIRDSIYVIHLE